MKYCSTRGGEQGVSFEDVLLAAYAVDGGLYVPETLPVLSVEQLLEWSHLPFSEVCAEVVHMFSDIDKNILRGMTAKAFSEFNDGKTPLPMHHFGDTILLDASQGPTLAFKDVGQQLVAQLLNYVLGQKGKTANIVVETSGDTGPAAIAGVRGCPQIQIFCLYPQGRVSAVQELQMVTVDDKNVHVYSTDGDSDEQASVLKEIFSDQEFVKRFNICSINSINWVRVLVQSSYYVWSYLQIYNTRFTIGKPVVFSIPTGAFGNAMGGFLAKMIGLPIHRIVCATNVNDIVDRTISRGDLSMGKNIATVSPAMDIQFAYNIERMLYYICNRNSVMIGEIMSRVERQYSIEPGSPAVTLDAIILSRIQEVFVSCSVNDANTLQTIKDFYHRYKFTLCPHSAIAVHAVTQVFPQFSEYPRICVLTAHPAKFEEAIQRALGHPPEFPARVQRLRTLPTKCKALRKTTESGQLEEGWRQRWIETLRKDIEDAQTSTD